MFIKVNWFWWK